LTRPLLMSLRSFISITYTNSRLNISENVDVKQMCKL